MLSSSSDKNTHFWTVANCLSLVFVVFGLVNSMPYIPGLEPLLQSVTGIGSLKIRQFTPEYYYPVAFVVMLIIAVLHNSVWREWKNECRWRRILGLCMDISLVLATFAIALTYMTELESICLIDQVTGDRTRLIEQAFAAEIKVAKLLDMPLPTTIDDPDCLHTTGRWIIVIVGVCIVIFLMYNIKVWGLPLVLVAIGIVGYTFFTILMWYVYGADGMNKYFVTKLGGDPRSLWDGRETIYDIVTNTQTGFLGRFITVILNTVFPYIILGTLFGASAGGKSLLKLAFRWTRRLRGGPAHAAVVSSATFGTISGGPVTNVLSTGVLTIPMMLQRGFNKVFAGGVEAAASSGGSIMPPVMGVAALVLASITGIPYSDVVVAALIPALAYFVCLFMAVSFQSRKQGIQAYGDLTRDMILSRQEKLNLIMILLPVLTILILLLLPKESIGCGLISGFIGVDRTIVDGVCRVNSLPWVLQLIQNSAGNASGAGWWAVAVLSVLLFLDPKVRAKPSLLLQSFSKGGAQIAKLYLMFLLVSIIDFCLQFTGLPTFISLDIIKWLHTFNLGAGGSVAIQLIALVTTMLIAVLLGMGMPAVPAYLNVALLMGPILSGLGLSILTAHMFIFYYAVASAITPPVALASYAAASITGACPMRTGFSGLRAGVVMFVIPFVFALYPEILLVEQAQIDPNATTGQVAYLMGYDGTIDWGNLSLLLVRLVLVLYLLASALTRYDMQALSVPNTILRIVVCIGIMFMNAWVFVPAMMIGMGIIVVNYMLSVSHKNKETVS